MRDSFVRSLLSSVSSSDNVVQRIRGNFHDALARGKWKMSSANGAPLHLLHFDRSAHSSRAQGISLLTHSWCWRRLPCIHSGPRNPRKMTLRKS